jgi:SulP family sulfate permease
MTARVDTQYRIFGVGEGFTESPAERGGESDVLRTPQTERFDIMTWLPKFVVCLSYYDRFRFRSDAFAALFLALQIFPLAIAIAVATGVPPLYGVFCAAIAGLLASVFGDSKIRVTAPNVVFVAVASSIVAREGILALSLSTLLAGVLLVFFGAIGLGAAIRMLPRPVVVGFSTGIAVLVVSQRVPDLLGIGLQIVADPVPRAALTLIRYPAQIDPHTIILALSTLILITVCRRASRYIPTSLIAITTGALLVKFGHFPVRTIESLFGSDLRSFHLHMAGAFRLDLLSSILAQGFAIAVLVAIESYQAMGLAANLTGERFNSNGELFVQGGVNIASAFAGGLPASGVSSHTFDNARIGAQTPIAGILQAVFLVVFLLLMAPLFRFIPLPVISAIILSSVFSMTNWQEVLRLMKVPRIEAAAWVATSLLTIITDLSTAIAVGMLIGMFFFIRTKPAILSKAAPGRLH